MKKQQITFSYIKKGATKKTKAILDQITQVGGFEIVDIKPFVFTEYLAKEFYKEHEGKVFFERLWRYTAWEAVQVMILSHPTSLDVVADFRKFIGATDPNKAEIGTIREKYGDKVEYLRNLPANAIHGSDSHENAIRESKLVGFDVSEYE